MGRSKKRYHGVSDDKNLEEHFLNMLSKLRVTSGPPRGHIERLAWNSWEAKLHVDETVAKLIKRPTVITELHQCVLRERQDMKEWSRGGSVRQGKRLVDLGNWKYSVLYCWMYSASFSCHECQECQTHFQALSERYATLRIDAPYTDNSIAMKGDVMECILYTATHTGDAIEPSMRQDRLQTKNDIRQVDIFLNRLLNIVADGDHLPVSALPSPVFVINLIQDIFKSNSQEQVQ